MESTPPRNGIPTSGSIRLQSSGSIRLERDASVRVKDYAQRVAFLEAENEKLSRQLHEGSAASQVELAFLRKQIEESSEKMARSRERIARVDQVEAAVISLYLEMKDRSAEGDEPADLEKERAELKGQNPIVVLDYLRANLRTLLTFKEEYENELKSQLARKRSEQEKQIESMKGEMTGLRTTAGEASDRVREAENRVRAAEDRAQAREATLRDEIRRLQQELAGGESRLSERDLEIAKMKIELRRLKEVERSKDIKITHISQVENQVQALKVQHEHDIHKINVRHATILERYERELARLNAIEGEKQALEAELRVAAVTTESYRVDIRRAEALRADRAVERLETIVARQGQEISALTKQLRRAQMVVQNTLGRNESLRKEYDKIVEALREQRSLVTSQEEQARQEMQAQLGVSTADRSTAYSAVMYRQQLKEKDREIQELTNKVRRLMADGLRRSKTSETSLAKGGIGKGGEDGRRKKVEEEIAQLRASAHKFQPMLKAERSFDAALPSAPDGGLKGLGVSPGLAAAMGMAPSPSIAAYQEEQMAALQQRAAVLEARLRDMELDSAIASGGLRQPRAKSPPASQSPLAAEDDPAAHQTTYIPVPQGSAPLGDWVDTSGQRGVTRKLFAPPAGEGGSGGSGGSASEGEGAGGPRTASASGGRVGSAPASRRVSGPRVGGGG